MLKWKWLAILAALLILPAFAASGGQQEPEKAEKPQSASERFADAVNGWIDELAGQPGFESWKNATWTRQPLGAGMHGWIVILKDDEGRETGYLVVAADPQGGLSLAEYGLGEYPLFGEKTLHRAMVKHELIDETVSLRRMMSDPAVKLLRLYADPFHALWLVTHEGDDYRFDAKTGELLPADAATLKELLRNMRKARDAAETWAPGESGEAAAGKAESARTAAAGGGTGEAARPKKLKKAAAMEAFDPYYDLSWLTEDPVAVGNQRQLLAKLDEGRRLVCEVDLYGGAAAFAYAVTGYHRWDKGGAYIALEHWGARYVPAGALLRSCTFHEAGSKGEPIWRD